MAVDSGRAGARVRGGRGVTFISFYACDLALGGRGWVGGGRFL